MILGLMTAAQHRAAVEEALRKHEENRRVTEGLLNARIKILRGQLARFTSPRQRDDRGRYLPTTSVGEAADA